MKGRSDSFGFMGRVKGGHEMDFVDFKDIGY
jgi:hypothetical protein